MENENIRKIVDRFDHASWVSTVGLFRKNEREPYIGFLLNAPATSLPMQEIFAHGMKHMPDKKEMKRDAELSNYFFILSELRDLNANIRSFALDVSEYLDGMFEVDPCYQSFDPVEEFETKIKPLL